jgi:hypothetical protein
MGMASTLPKVVAAALLLPSLLLSTTASGAAKNDAVPAFTAELVFSPQVRFPLTSRVFRLRHEPYRFALIPDTDVERHLVVFELSLVGAGRVWRANNLLDPTGRVHGSQKWTFAASDFAHGTENSGYGATRTIDLPNRGLTVQIDVVRAAVTPTPATSKMPASYRFTGLTLRVRAWSAPVRRNTG